MTRVAHQHDREVTVKHGLRIRDLNTTQFDSTFIMRKHNFTVNKTTIISTEFAHYDPSEFITSKVVFKRSELQHTTIDVAGIGRKNRINS